MREIKQGDVYWADIPTANLGGYIQRFKRPWLVVSNDWGNSSSPNVTIVPLTTKNKKQLPTHVDVYVNGMLNTVECEQAVTVGKELLEKRCHIMSQKDMEAVNRALAMQFQLAGGRYET